MPSVIGHYRWLKVPSTDYLFRKSQATKAQMITHLTDYLMVTYPVQVQAALPNPAGPTSIKNCRMFDLSDTKAIERMIIRRRASG